jgi:hypothetical protein
LDQNYSAALHQVSVAEQALAKAIETGNGAQVPELLRARDRAMAQAAEINRAKQTAEAPRQQSMDSLALNRAKSWAAENNWFKPDGKDADSAVVKALDESLMAEGFNPATQEYWDELTDRASRYLPHRFAESDDLFLCGRFAILKPDERFHALTLAGHRDAARNEVNKKYGNQDCKTFKDFQELLALKDINAVSIGTPDHWHALVSIAAANTGKDIYCEKPLANSVGEGRAIADAFGMEVASHGGGATNLNMLCAMPNAFTWRRPVPSAAW